MKMQSCEQMSKDSQIDNAYSLACQQLQDNDMANYELTIAQIATLKRWSRAKASRDIQELLQMKRDYGLI